MYFGSYFNRYGLDNRVAEAQLDFAAEVVRAWRYINPLWTTLLALICTDVFPVFGKTPLWRALLFPALATTTILFGQHLVSRYRADEKRRCSDEGLQQWFKRFLLLQVLLSATWGLAPWLLWQPENLANHLYLGAVMLGMIGATMITRANHIGLFLAAVLPQACMTILRFALAGTVPDILAALLIAGAIAKFWFDGRRLTNSVGDNAVGRVKVEELARDLKEARDEALYKRFEAETANASKTRFLASMSHELRTPLNAILGFSEMIQKERFGPAGSPRYTEYATDIHASGKHLLNLINDMLDVAKIEAGKMAIDPVPLNIPYAIDCVVHLMEAKALEKRQQLSVHLPPGIASLTADERALKQILINLVSNAIKFTPEGGSIRIIGEALDRGIFRLTVEDTGPGLPYDALERVFTPFNRMDNRYDSEAGGTGLGLALVRGLAKLHGGRAWMESEPDKGCRACVALPGLTVERESAYYSPDVAAAA